MRPYLIVIMSAVASSVFLASPAKAKTIQHHHRAASDTTYVPNDTRGSVAPTDVYSSESQGHQSFRNPDRDFSIENLRSHPSN